MQAALRVQLGRARRALRVSELAPRPRCVGPGSVPSPRCWSCGVALSGLDAVPHFCPRCRALQPPEPRPDLFRLMECDRSFRIDTQRLQRRFRSLQRALHPDRFGQSPAVSDRPRVTDRCPMGDALCRLRAPGPLSSGESYGTPEGICSHCLQCSGTPTAPSALTAPSPDHGCVQGHRSVRCLLTHYSLAEGAALLGAALFPHQQGLPDIAAPPEPRPLPGECWDGQIHTPILGPRSRSVLTLREPIFTFPNSCFVFLQLELRGVEPAQETDCDEDKEFLMEIMEINEKLAEPQNDEILGEIETLIKGGPRSAGFVPSEFYIPVLSTETCGVYIEEEPWVQCWRSKQVELLGSEQPLVCVCVCVYIYRYCWL
uniref:J domain-containing protein n=1 Tax=Coturnix japonica TaxID=93934 RepID=A0A8C2TA83_COTJA